MQYSGAAQQCGCAVGRTGKSTLAGLSGAGLQLADVYCKVAHNVNHGLLSVTWFVCSLQEHWSSVAVLSADTCRTGRKP